ncbi:MAG: hypothetical protein R3F34_17385 [Planctomycetota bacterium]
MSSRSPITAVGGGIVALALVLTAPVSAQVGGPDTALAAPDPSASARFGASLDTSGERAIVGANGDLSRGAAYVFDRTDGVFAESAKLTASDGDPGDDFGLAVAIDGDRALVGAHGWDAPGANEAGAAYVFERQTDGTWLEVAQLVATAPLGFAHLGWSVALEGDRALLGAVTDGEANFFAGAALVFERQGDGSWVETAKLTLEDAEVADSLGHSVALAGDQALVGALLDDEAGEGSGAVHVFELQGDSSWAHVQTLTAPDPVSNGRFGQSLAVDGDTAVVGTWIDDATGSDPGRAYVFARDGLGSWTLDATLHGKSGGATFGFGIDVDVLGDLVVVGSRRNSFGSPGPGVVRAFRREAPGVVRWLVDVSSAQQNGFDRFGASVAAVDDDEFLAGAWSDDSQGLQDAGLAHVTRVSDLMRGSPTVSIAAPQRDDLTIFAGKELGGAIHLLLGSATGTSPAALVDGASIPLVVDAYTDLLLGTLNQGVLKGNLGVLDANGAATVHFDLPVGLAPSYVGVRLWHAALVIDPGQDFWPPALVTEPRAIELVP